MYSDKTHAVCRGCGMELNGKPYHLGGDAYHPRTGQRCPKNHFGGYVCSRACDRKASLEQEQSMPGHGYQQKTLGQAEQRSLDNNWPESR